MGTYHVYMFYYMCAKQFSIQCIVVMIPSSSVYSGVQIDADLVFCNLT